MKKNAMLLNRLVYAVCGIFICLTTTAQVKVGDNPTTKNSDAMLEIESTNKGVLLPRLALTATTNATPLTAHVPGMVVYNTASTGDVTPGIYYNDGTKWVRTTGSSSSNVVSTVVLTSPASPAGTSLGQIAYNTGSVAPTGLIYWDGSKWQSVGGDPTVGNEVVNGTVNKGLARAGSGTAADPYTLGLTDGTTPNQTMVWDGTKWAPGTAGLATTALTSPTAPAGVNIGDMRYNTNAASGIPVGPVFWDGSKWAPILTNNTPMNVTTELDANYTALLTDDIILFNASQQRTLTLPTTGVVIGKRYYVTNKGATGGIDFAPTSAIRNDAYPVLNAKTSGVLMYVGNGLWDVVSGY
jgi:hypothetical protein